MLGSTIYIQKSARKPMSRGRAAPLLLLTGSPTVPSMHCHPFDNIHTEIHVVADLLWPCSARNVLCFAFPLAVHCLSRCRHPTANRCFVGAQRPRYSLTLSTPSLVCSTIYRQKFFRWPTSYGRVVPAMLPSASRLLSTSFHALDVTPISRKYIQNLFR
ncbi:hypothetical protein NEOLEDRAFT_154728 [Neolentinus lepideus HHB14362 ss-1]|uniref:Uncharacterized protein n=1 Tax=Neolentinus lepideus HHB14362 ss-1 TaxID=1314782 RepID=A0A165ML90_9AGAM|nr:hypothetical protein NEOLEDRAFT_154728 [Neolentinus lepideus HHB14362 ss-1]